MNRYHFITASLVLTLFYLDAGAEPACFEQASALAAGEDAYFSLEAEENAADLSRLQAVLKDISGRWSGKTVYLSCEGNPIHSNEVFDDGDVEVELATAEDGGLLLRATVDYYNGTRNVPVEYRSASERLTSLVDDHDYGISFSEKHRDDADTLIENTIDIHQRDGTLTLVRRTYVNGLLETAQIFGVSRRDN